MCLCQFKDFARMAPLLIFAQGAMMTAMGEPEHEDESRDEDGEEEEEEEGQEVAEVGEELMKVAFMD